MVNAISIDLEDWYHICGVHDRLPSDLWNRYHNRLENNVGIILDLLEHYQTRATFFVVGYIAEHTPELIQKVVGKGHEVATHGFFHRRIFDMKPEEFEEDLLRSKEVIEAVSGKKILGYRAPEWSLKKSTFWALDILKKHGFAYDTSAVPLSHLSGRFFGRYPHTIETRYGELIEFPLSTFPFFWERLPFSGGLPMRIVPYCHILAATNAINMAGYPAIFYLHPWEFDRERIPIDLPLNRRFMHYFNLAATPRKAELMLKHFEFSTVEEVLGLRKSTPSSGSSSQGKSARNSYMDKAYYGSLFSSLGFTLCVYSAVFFVSYLSGYYAALIIVAIATTWYLPWDILFRLIERLRRCCCNG